MADGASDPAASSSPQSVARIVAILEALCASAQPISLAALSRSLDTPKSSLAALLRGLEGAGLVSADSGSWSLAAGAFGLGSALVEARRRLHSSDLVRDGLRQLAERTGETVLFAVTDPHRDMLTYVEIVESRHAVRFAVNPGDRRPLYCTAAGRALLAAMPDAQVTAYLERLDPVRLTPATATDKTELAALIEAARATGVAQTVDQASNGVTGTAAVIRDASGSAIGAITVAAPTSRLAECREAMAALVRDHAAAISRSLGHRDLAAAPTVTQPAAARPHR